MAKSTEKLNKNGDRRGMSLNSQKNIASALKVLKGNNHAKKDYSITCILKEMANDPAPERWLEVEDKGKGYTLRQATARRIWIEAVRGNAKIIGELMDRTDGKVTQPIGGEGGGPVITKILVTSEQDKENVERVTKGERT